MADSHTLRDLITSKLKAAGLHLSFLGVSEDEIFILTVPNPTVNSLPREYYQVRVIVEPAGRQERDSLTVESALVRLKTKNAVIVRTLERDVLSAQIENAVIDYTMSCLRTSR